VNNRPDQQTSIKAPLLLLELRPRYEGRRTFVFLGVPFILRMDVGPGPHMSLVSGYVEEVSNTPGRQYALRNNDSQPFLLQAALDAVNNPTECTFIPLLSVLLPTVLAAHFVDMARHVLHDLPPQANLSPSDYRQFASSTHYQTGEQDLVGLATRLLTTVALGNLPTLLRRPDFASCYGTVQQTVEQDEELLHFYCERVNAATVLITSSSTRQSMVLLLNEDGTYGAGTLDLHHVSVQIDLVANKAHVDVFAPNDAKVICTDVVASTPNNPVSPLLSYYLKTAALIMFATRETAASQAPASPLN